jgi:hypothetical protein
VSDDYPTDEELQKITDFNVDDNNLDEFIEGIKSIWHWPDFVKKEEKVYTFATGGWSGNEEIIMALRKNTFFWLMYWESSTRGGKYVFCKCGDYQTLIDEQKRIEELRVKAIKDVLECPYYLDEATIPKAGIDSAPNQVVGNMSMSIVKRRALQNAIKEENNEQ